MSCQYCVTCQVSKVTRVKSLSEFQFGFEYLTHLKDTVGHYWSWPNK